MNVSAKATKATVATKTTFKGDEVIMLNPDLKGENPKRKNKKSFDMFQVYIANPNLTVAEFLDLSKSIHDKNNTDWLRWDVKKGYIKIV